MLAELAGRSIKSAYGLAMAEMSGVETYKSAKTFLVLNTVGDLCFPVEERRYRENQEKCKTVMALTDFIYAANDYFDIGTRAREIYQKVNGSTPHFFVFQSIYEDVRCNFQAKQKALLNQVSESESSVITNFTSDGMLLSELKTGLDVKLFRELDNAIYALLVFGVLGKDIQNTLGIDTIVKCKNITELMDKYKLLTFCSDTPGVEKLNNNQKLARGLQAVEMIMAVMDDKWGKDQDLLFGIPNTYSKENYMKNIKFYENEAGKCGFPIAVCKLAEMAVLTYPLKLALKKRAGPVEPSKFRKERFKDIYAKREWLIQAGVFDLLPRSF